jgi:hypothetical protein
MADVPQKAREDGECDLQINSTYRPFGLLASAMSPAWISRTALNPFWTKAESLGTLTFIRPQGDGSLLSSAIVSAATAIFRT